jgi:hypothetical protein
LARWLRARGVEAHLIHPSSVAVSREHRRAKTDRRPYRPATIRWRGTYRSVLKTPRVGPRGPRTRPRTPRSWGHRMRARRQKAPTVDVVDRKPRYEAFPDTHTGVDYRMDQSLSKPAEFPPARTSGAAGRLQPIRARSEGLPREPVDVERQHKRIGKHPSGRTRSRRAPARVAACPELSSHRTQGSGIELSVPLGESTTNSAQLQHHSLRAADRTPTP